MVRSKAVRGIAGDKWLLKLEQRAFGWHFWSTANEHEYGVEVNSDGSARTTHKIIQWLEFRRVSPYTHNFLFKMTEFFSKIFSFFRRIFFSFGFPLLIIAVIGGVLGTYAFEMPDVGDIFFTVAKWLAIAYAISVGGTFLFAGLGLLWRKAFKIDAKLKKIYGDDLAAICVFQDEV